MATYYHGGSEIQADGLQTLYLMNPNYNTGYSDTQHQQQQSANMLFLNSAAANALTTAILPHAPPPQSHHFVGIPLPTTSNPDHEIPSLHGILPRFHYNLWGSADQTPAGNHPHQHVPAAVAAASGSGGIIDGLFHKQPIVSPTARQGLSLSLSSQAQPDGGFRSFSGDNDVSGKAPAAENGGSPSVSNGISGGVQSVILGSKYLKAAQQLLDEVVNVGKAVKMADGGEGTKEKKVSREYAAAVSGGGDGSSGGGESSGKRATELTTAQRQELQTKKAKLVSMLDEVEQRYKQYHRQMQLVASSFEQASGIGSARSYTALALQTISKQFRCLKDAISAQIKATSKSLGEDTDHGLGGKVAEGSRLKFVDHQLRQQRALQQLGMIQHNAWRPQRGLPERAVSILRAWLFEHFLHPYPKDSDKHILAKQTGLSRSQVSNWFINARVRLWKPMVEEMYLEETKDQEQNGSDGKNKDSVSKSTDPQQNTTTFQMDQTTTTLPSKQERLIQEMEGIAQRSPKKPRSYDKQSSSPSSILSMDMDMKMKNVETTKGIISESFGIERQRENWGNGFGSYPIGEIGRFDAEELVTRFNGNSVSLTLGLPHCENNLSLSGNQQNYLSSQNIGHQLGSRLDIGGGGGVETRYNGVNAPQPSLSNGGYDNISIQNRKLFAAQLLHDFVA